MNRTDFLYGELSKEWLDEKEGKLTVISKTELHRSVNNQNYMMSLCNKKGMKIWGGEYTEVQAGLNYLEKYLVKKREKANIRPTPFSQLCDKVNSITEVNFNNTKAGSLSNNATYKGWDICRTTDAGFIKIHNAANGVARFDLLQERYDVSINLINISTYGNELEEFSKVLRAIHEYLAVPVAERKAEFEGQVFPSDIK